MLASIHRVWIYGGRDKMATKIAPFPVLNFLFATNIRLITGWYGKECSNELKAIDAQGFSNKHRLMSFRHICEAEWIYTNQFCNH